MKEYRENGNPPDSIERRNVLFSRGLRVNRSGGGDRRHF